MSATIKDVAETAGCSIATVSRFVNGTGPIAADTRERIERAVARLGYRPSEIGRSLKRQASRTFGVLVPCLTNPVFAASVAGFQERARAAGYNVLIASTDYDVTREVEAVETLLTRSVEGLALTVCDALSSPALAVLDATTTPHVLLYNPADRADRTAITVDNAAAAQALTNTILAAGHRRIAFLAGRFAASDRSRLRYRGFSRALAAAGIAPPAPVEIDFADEAPDAAVAPLLAGDHPATALFCSNDVLALAAIGAVHRLGLSVPRDVSVAGFDGIAIGRMVEPALTTVVQPARAMGEAAADALLQRIAGTPAAPPAPQPFTLFRGRSLGPVPDRRPASSPATAAPPRRSPIP